MTGADSHLYLPDPGTSPPGTGAAERQTSGVRIPGLHSGEREGFTDQGEGAGKRGGAWSRVDAGRGAGAVAGAREPGVSRDSQMGVSTPKNSGESQKDSRRCKV